MRVSLNGEWTLVDGAVEVPVVVPGCWEDAGVAKERPGPFTYRRDLEAPPEMRGRRLWLRFDGVSYHAVVKVDGREVGRHTGAWDAFEVEVTGAVTPGGPAATLEVEVEKPASLVAGPASEPVSGAFPLKETLSGFLPYVWGHMFGGLWQDVWLEARAAGGEVEDAHIWAAVDGSFTAVVELPAPASVLLQIVDASGEVVAEVEGTGDSLHLTGTVTDVEPWSPSAPYLYTARLLVAGEKSRTWTFGFRSLSADGRTLLLNGRPLYPRLALSWGWHDGSLAPNFSRESVAADLAKLKELGYNGVKCCLWVPPQHYLDVADELGMLVWLELPMWLPKPSDFFRRQVPVEYERIVRQVRRHPCLVLYSLGCELNREVGAEILAPLFEGVKALVGDALLRDNSGSGEAYGGLLNEHAEYYDYHFYSESHFLGELIDHFTPRWRPVQPWLFGEFCDYDSFRDLDRLASGRGGLPWWTSADPQVNPQGARWQYDVPFQQERLAANGLAQRAAELEWASHQQALLHRKFTLELVRGYREIAGYVVTGERDTPISTAGMYDELGEFKFAPERFRAFNRDLVLTLGWDKRRMWVDGGDRAAYWDTYSYPAGSLVRAHLIASNYSDLEGVAELRWELSDAGRRMAGGEAAVTLQVGDVRELGVLEFSMPAAPPARRLTLRAEVHARGAVQTANEWSLWCLPAAPWADLGPFALWDPSDKLAGLRELVVAEGSAVTDDAEVVLATVWSDRLEAAVRGGGRAVLLLSGSEPSPFSCARLPFWREAVKLLEPHPAWGDFPHDGFTDLQFYGMAAAAAVDSTALAGAKSLLRRVDTRTMAVHDYALELPWGGGRLLVSTLRFEGGHGHQPVGVRRNTAAAFLLSRWLTYLRDSG